MVIVLGAFGYSQLPGETLIDPVRDKFQAEPVVFNAAPPADSMLARLMITGEIKLHPTRLPLVPDEEIDQETLWLARCIFSETKRPEEQELVAWVVRNRVETQYRGKETYEAVVLDPWQFSAFNRDDDKRHYYRNLTLRNKNIVGWQRAVSIAYYVRHASASYRPFSDQTLFFYSERSMVGRSHPTWARGMTQIHPPERYKIDERRFRFFAGVMS